MQDETVWLTQQQLMQLYRCSKSNISEHIKQIFDEGELDKDSVVRKFRTTASDGKNYNVDYYNLDMIISLGYRIKSVIATKFRQWAAQRLKEYWNCIKGCVKNICIYTPIALNFILKYIGKFEKMKAVI